MEPLESEGRASAVEGDALQAVAVGALDANRCIDAEAAGALPDPPMAGARHVLGDLLLQEAVAAMLLLMGVGLIDVARRSRDGRSRLR